MHSNIKGISQQVISCLDDFSFSDNLICSFKVICKCVTTKHSKITDDWRLVDLTSPDRAMDLDNMDEVWENLRSHRVQVVQELRVDRTLLFEFLRSKAIFDSEDCELVQAEKTNERKASKLLDILQTKGTESLVHFLDVVQLLNPAIYEKLTGQKATTSKSRTA